MKKIIICFLSLCLLWTTPLNVFAVGSYDYDESAKITVSVPEKHEIETDFSEDIMFYVDGKVVNFSEIDRLSEHTFKMDRFDKNGREIKQVFLNGKDITDEIFGEGFTIPSVHEDLKFSVVYVDEDSPSTTAAATETTKITTTETTSTNTTPAEITQNTTRSKMQAITKFTSAIIANQNDDGSPDTGDHTPFGISIFLIVSAFGVYLFRKKE